MHLTPELEAEGLALAEKLSSVIRYEGDDDKAAAFIRASLAREKAADEAHLAFRREVSDAVLRHINQTDEDCSALWRAVTRGNIGHLILPPAPDPYEVKAREIVGEHEIWLAAQDTLVASIAAALREASETKP
jgi:hypothetical protein